MNFTEKPRQKKNGTKNETSRKKKLPNTCTMFCKNKDLQKVETWSMQQRVDCKLD